MCLKEPGTLRPDSLGDQQSYQSSGERIKHICKDINLEISLETESYLWGRDANTLSTR